MFARQLHKLLEGLEMARYYMDLLLVHFGFDKMVLLGFFYYNDGQVLALVLPSIGLAGSLV